MSFGMQTRWPVGVFLLFLGPGILVGFGLGFGLEHHPTRRNRFRDSLGG